MKTIIRVVAGLELVLGIIQVIFQLTAYSRMAAGYGMTLSTILFQEGAIGEVLSNIILILGFFGVLLALSEMVGKGSLFGKAKAEEKAVGAEAVEKAWQVIEDAEDDDKDLEDAEDDDKDLDDAVGEAEEVDDDAGDDDVEDTDEDDDDAEDDDDKDLDDADDADDSEDDEEESAEKSEERVEEI